MYFSGVRSVFEGGVTAGPCMGLRCITQSGLWSVFCRDGHSVLVHGSEGTDKHAAW